MPSSADLCFKALALERGLLQEAELDLAMAEAKRRARPLERHLVEAGLLQRDVARELDVARTQLARGCTVCRKVTYLLPGAELAATPCEHCKGALAPPTRPPLPKAPPKPAAAVAANEPASAPKAKSLAEPKSGLNPAPKSGVQPAPKPADPKSAVVAAPKSGVNPAPKPADPARSAVSAAPKSGTNPAPKPAGPARSAVSAAPKSGTNPAPKSGPHAAPEAESKIGAVAAPKSGPHAVRKTPKPEPEPVAVDEDAEDDEPAPRKAGAAPALVDDDDDWTPLPPWVGRCRVEALLCDGETVFVYAGRIGDELVAVRSLRPELVTHRRVVDTFFRAAQAATEAGFHVLDLGVDGAGVPFVAVRRDDDATIAERLRDLAPPPVDLRVGNTKSDTGSLVFAQLQRQREELSRLVSECSRRRDRCISHFVLLDELSREAGVLWRAFDTEKDELVSVRVLDAGPAAEAGRLVKPLADTLALAERVRNPQIAALRAYGVDERRLFLVRPHMPAPRPLGGASLEIVLNQAHEGAQALAHLHAQGLAHGGLHPGSIVADGSGKVTLIDIGLAPALGAAGQADLLPWRMVRAGCTPLPTADTPPLAAGDPAAWGTQQNDIFALGAILYRAAGMFIPDEVPAPAAPPDRAADTLAVALRALSSDPAARYTAMVEVARDLELVLAGKVPQARVALAPRTQEAKAKPASSVIGTLSGVFKRLLGR